MDDIKIDYSKSKYISQNLMKSTTSYNVFLQR